MSIQTMFPIIILIAVFILAYIFYKQMQNKIQSVQNNKIGACSRGLLLSKID
jgi:uncharacterized membrane protein